MWIHPNGDTGTGKALVLDGQDAGMVSAVVVDSEGRVVTFIFSQRDIQHCEWTRSYYRCWQW